MDKARRAAELVRTLATLGHASALVGGLAVSVRTRERFTKDVDFAVAVASDREAEQLAYSMQRAGFQLVFVIEQEAQGVIATVRFRHPEDEGTDPTVDLLCGATGIEREIVHGSTLVRIAEGTSIPIARIPHLIAMKVLSESPNRDQDRSDLRALIRVASSSELDEAKQAVALIEERGYHRDKDLQAALAAFVRDMR